MKQNLKIKCLKGLSVVVATFLMFPCVSFADEGDADTTVEAFADNTNDNIERNVGNVNVTTEYYLGIALGIYATAKDGKTATVNAKDVTVNANTIMENGIDATAGSDNNNTPGKVYITTQSVKSRGDGVLLTSQIEGSELYSTTNGNITGCVDNEDDACDGLYGYAQSSAKLNAVVNGSVKGTWTGIGIRPAGEGLNNNGIVVAKSVLFLP